jgi:hypothetical protein
MNADKTCTAIFTATPSSKLYFPHIDAKSPRRTEVAVINGSSTSASGTLKGYSSTGSLIETKNISLPSHGRWEKDVAVEFVSSRDIEYMIFESESDTAHGYAKSVDAGLSRVALPAVRELNAALDIYVSHIASDDYWWTAIGLLNTNTSSKMVSISFDDGRSTTVSLAAGEKKLLTIASLFAGIPQPGVRSAVIGNAGGVIGWELFGSRNGKQQDGLLLTGSASTTLYYPHIDCDGWWTGIVAYNESSAGAALTVNPYNKEGAPFPTITENVAGKGKYIGLASHLGLPAGTEWLRINSSQPLSGFELFGNADGRQLAAYSALRSGGARWGILPKLEQEGWTGIVFVNAEESAASITLTAYSDDGTVVATRLLALGGHAKVVNLAENIFSQAIASATYIVYSSDRNVVGFQLNGSADGAMLDGLPTLGN